MYILHKNSDTLRSVEHIIPESLGNKHLLTVYLCYLSDCHCFTTYKFGCFFGVPTGEVLPRISFLLREGNVLRP